MKMSEFLSLSDDRKVELLDAAPETDMGNEDYSTMTEDKGVCNQCGGEADAGDFCFGCHKLICPKCFEEEPHLSGCVAKVK